MSLCTTIYCTLASFLLFLVIVGQAIYAIIKYFIPRCFKRKSVKGKIVVITGGGSGIGRMVGQKLAAKGAIIVSWDINEKGNEETVRLIREKGGKSHAYTVDICDRHCVYNIACKVKAEVGKVDILINNAGVVNGQHFLEASDEQILKTFNVNTISHFWTTKAFLPEMMRANSGHVVTISSVAGSVGAGKLVDYCASKFSAVGFNESLFIELKTGGYDGVHTTLVCPYFTNTGMFDGVRSRVLPILEQDYVAEEITDAILTRTKSLIMPIFIRFYIAIKGIVPHSSISLAYRIFVGKKSMDTFTGHKGHHVDSCNS